MNVEVDVDERYWAKVPPSFPSDGFADVSEWSDHIVARYRSVRPGADAAEVQAMRSVAEQAAASLVDTATFGLLFMPAPVPAAALVHLEVFAASEHARDDLRAVSLDDTLLAAEPFFDDLVVPGFGAGVVSRYLVAQPDRPNGAPALAGLAYAINGGTHLVRIVVSPTSTTMIGLLDQQLGEVVTTLRVVA